jgi:hypothetical protein
MVHRAELDDGLGPDAARSNDAVGIFVLDVPEAFLGIAGK